MSAMRNSGGLLFCCPRHRSAPSLYLASDISLLYISYWQCHELLPESQQAGTQVSGPGIVLDWMDCASWVDGVEYRLGARIPPREPFQRLLAGGIAGAFSRTGACPNHMADKSITSLNTEIRAFCKCKACLTHVACRSGLLELVIE